jgi:hypothetical protein
MNEKLSAKVIMALAHGFQPSCIIIAGAELDVFTLLHARPMNAAQLANRIKGDLRATTVLLDALAANRLLVKDAGQNPRYHVPPAVAAVLTETGSQSLLGAIRHRGNTLLANGRNWPASC